MKKKEKPVIKIVELNNKSRKGTYIYIKEKGKAKYYKYEEDIPIDAYLIQARSGKKTTKGLMQKYAKVETRQGKELQQYIEQIRRRGSLQKQIKKGMGQVTIKNVEKATQATINRAKRKLLQHLILDKQLLDIITQDHNLDKLKERFEYRIKVKDKEGKTLVTGNKFNQTIKQTIQEINTGIKKGMNTSTEITDEVRKTLKQRGWKDTKTVKTGITRTTDLTIIFRKGRWKQEK